MTRKFYDGLDDQEKQLLRSLSNRSALPSRSYSTTLKYRYMKEGAGIGVFGLVAILLAKAGIYDWGPFSAADPTPGFFVAEDGTPIEIGGADGPQPFDDSSFG